MHLVARRWRNRFHLLFFYIRIFICPFVAVNYVVGYDTTPARWLIDEREKDKEKEGGRE